MLQKVKIWGGSEIKISTLTFGKGILVGFILSIILAPKPYQIYEIFYTFFEDVLTLEKQDFQSFFTTIYQGNVIASFMLIGLGLIHRYLSLIIIFGNGALLGLVIYVLVLYEGLDKIITLIAPHGIFELPAFILAGAIALRLTKRAKNFKDRFKILFNSSLAVLIVVTLLLIAASIEALLIVKDS